MPFVKELGDNYQRVVIKSRIIKLGGFIKLYLSTTTEPQILHRSKMTKDGKARFERFLENMDKENKDVIMNIKL